MWPSTWVTGSSSTSGPPWLTRTVRNVPSAPPCRSCKPCASLGELDPQGAATRGLGLQMRIGIHTGAVVVGDMGDSRRPEYLAVGETPNLAARVQGAARPDSVVVSDSTYRLTKGYFAFHDLGTLSLKGFSQPTNLYEVVGDLGVKNRLDLVGEVGLTPFVGRESEFALRPRSLERGARGQGARRRPVWRARHRQVQVGPGPAREARHGSRLHPAVRRVSLLSGHSASSRPETDRVAARFHTGNLAGGQASQAAGWARARHARNAVRPAAPGRPPVHSGR